MLFRVFLIFFMLTEFCFAVDLSEQENSPQSLDQVVIHEQKTNAAENYYNKQWFQRFDISGTLGGAYIRSNGEGARPYGSFNNKQFNLWIEAAVWDDLKVVAELFPFQYYGTDVGEAYLNATNILRVDGENRLSLKFGRFDLPYGDEYLFQDWIDNPLISRSAAWPWGWDAGVMFYGTYHKLGWIFALTDGRIIVSNADADGESNGETATFKLYGQMSQNLSGSLSFLSGGRHMTSSMWFGNNWFMKSGTLASGAGTGPQTGTSNSARFNSVEGDLKFTTTSLEMLVNYGYIDLVDLQNTAFNRTFSYYMIQPLYWLKEKWYLAGRYSYFGTFSGGYVMGNINKDGNYMNMSTTRGNVRGYSLSSLGLGYMPNPNTRLVAEMTQPFFDMSDSTDPKNSDRLAWGFKAVVKF